MSEQDGRRTQADDYEIKAVMRDADVGTLEVRVYEKAPELFAGRQLGTVIIHDWAYAKKELPPDTPLLTFSERVDFFGGYLCREQGAKPREESQETTADRLSYEEMLELVFAYLGRRGVKDVDTWVYAEEMDWCEREMGFTLMEWDNSGWEPKYFYTRKLD